MKLSTQKHSAEILAFIFLVSLLGYGGWTLIGFFGTTRPPAPVAVEPTSRVPDVAPVPDIAPDVSNDIHATYDAQPDTIRIVDAASKIPLIKLDNSLLTSQLNPYDPSSNKVSVTTKPPPLELERVTTEKPLGAGESSIKISTNFECGTASEIKQISATHFSVQIQLPHFRNWFLLRVDGAAGKTVRIDMTGPLGNWVTVNPVYTYAMDLDSPDTYCESTSDAMASTAWNGSELPDTEGQKWHYISNAWMLPAPKTKKEDDPRTFCFVHHFDSDSAYVAMRVPHPPGYNEQFFHKIAENPLAKVIEVGNSQQNRPLLMVKIGSGDEAAEKSRPCVLIYAGEHADEQDAMWVAQGAIEHLLDTTQQSEQLRQRFTFLVIPMLDPDESASGRHAGIITTFMPASQTPESIAYANWFQDWVNAGKRLDAILDLHNVQSTEGPNIYCALIESVGERGKMSAVLNGMIVSNIEHKFGARGAPKFLGWSPDRLGGWLSLRYGPITMAYETNAQAPDRHLNLHQLKEMGQILTETMPAFFASPDGAALLSNVDARRKERLDRWAKHGPMRTGTDAIGAEDEVSKDVGMASTGTNDPAIEKWIP